jgi:exodeoxyribonuclease V
MILTVKQKEIVNILEDQILQNCSSKYNKSRMNYQFISKIGGYAGTGKTTILCELRKQLKKKLNISVAFLTFTGKASSVLKNKLEINKSLYPNDYVGTIHGLLYKPQTRWDNKLKTHVIVGWKLKNVDEIFYDLILIDEASMVSKDIWLDLLKYEKPIIAVGDHGQLPPVGDNFNLMKDPDFKLTEIHRQALDSPIILLSKIAREEGCIPTKIFSPQVFKLSWDHPWCKTLWDEKIDFQEDLIILCGFNTTRANLNDKLRQKLGYNKQLLYPGEKIVCLKNNHYAEIMNGQIGEVVWIMPENDDLFRITLNINSELYEVLAAKKCFGEVQYTMFDKPLNLNLFEQYAVSKGYNTVTYFDYGYALSVHKSQGDEWNRVILFEQRSKHWDDQYYSKWLYTAITRAKQKLMIIDNSWI